MNHHNHYGSAHNTPKFIVVHCMGEFIEVGDCAEHAADFLLRQGLSAHVLVAPGGEVYRCRLDSEGAYHAKSFNTDSLGIEFLVKGEHDYDSFAKAIEKPYLDDEQYKAGVTQVREWLKLHKIDMIVRHSELSPGRKIDPGEGFPWEKFLIDVHCVE